MSATESQTAKLRVTGMTCGGCANSVKLALKAVAGVTDANVSLEQGLAVIDFDPDICGIEPLLEAVRLRQFGAELAG